MMFKKLAPLALAGALAVAGCGDVKATDGKAVKNQAGQESGLKVAIVTHSDEGSFWSVVKRGAEAASRSEGVDLTWSPSNNDPQKQAQLIDAAVSEKVDGIAVSVPEASAIKDSLKKATTAGIPIITLNSGQGESESLGAITHVGQDEAVAGEAAGERLKESGAKKVMCIVHEQGNIGLEDRCKGVASGFGGETENLQVKGTADISTTQTEIRSKLQADKSFDAVMALNPDIAGAAQQAVKGAGSKAKLATFDINPAVIKAIERGTIDFAVDQQQYLQGYLPIVLLKLYKTNANTIGGGLPVLTGPGFVDAENASEVAKLAEEGTR